VRYSIFTAMAQLGLLILLAPWLARIWSRLGQCRLLQICVIGAAVLMLAQQVVAGRAGAQVAGQYIEAYRQFAAGLWTPAMVQFVHPDRKLAEQGQTLVVKLGIYRSY
jgi:hypothetical protein